MDWYLTFVFSNQSYLSGWVSPFQRPTTQKMWRSDVCVCSVAIVFFGQKPPRLHRGRWRIARSKARCLCWNIKLHRRCCSSGCSFHHIQLLHPSDPAIFGILLTVRVRRIGRHFVAVLLTGGYFFGYWIDCRYKNIFECDAVITTRLLARISILR